MAVFTDIFIFTTGMGDLKTISHINSYSLDRRGIVGPPPRGNSFEPTAQFNNNKHASLTKLHNNKNTAISANINNNGIPSTNSTTTGIANNGDNNTSPQSYPVPPPRPPSHQSTCSNIEVSKSGFY